MLVKCAEESGCYDLICITRDDFDGVNDLSHEWRRDFPSLIIILFANSGVIVIGISLTIE